MLTVMCFFIKTIVSCIQVTQYQYQYSISIVQYTVSIRHKNISHEKDCIECFLFPLYLA
jgi:hypothetical protein